MDINKRQSGELDEVRRNYILRECININIVFNKITLHKFGCFLDAEIILRDRGFCQVVGQNAYPVDNAASNGSGKSTIWNALCFALTARTLQGVDTHLRNDKIPSQDCFVSLDFNVDGVNYVITRKPKPGSELTIIQNGIDISGKTFTATEALLKQLLPDLTSDILGQVIMLGQGLPQKFSSLKPTDRKELLERVTHSDFMVEDVKARISAVLDENKKEQQKKIEEQVSAKTLVATYTKIYNDQNTILLNRVKPDFDSEILQATESEQTLITDIDNLTAEYTTLKLEMETCNTNLLEQTNQKSQTLLSLNESYNSSISDQKIIKCQLESDIRALKQEINTLKSISDTCPTCKQKLVGVEKPSTEQQESKLKETQEKLEKISTTIAEADTKYREYKSTIDAQFDDTIKQLQTQLNTFKMQLNTLNLNIEAKRSQKESYTKKIISLNSEKLNFDTITQNIVEQRDKAQEEINSSTEELKTVQKELDILTQRIQVLKDAETESKQGFRSYLLQDYVRLFDTAAKEYCEVVFKNRELEIKLEGNAIEIYFEGKPYESLSGGEKQRCDIITQLAIRKLLMQYGNFSCNILVLDEITDNLDKTSCTAIVDLITMKLQDVESVFIVSHHVRELDLPMDSEITVVKNINGIGEIY